MTATQRCSEHSLSFASFSAFFSGVTKSPQSKLLCSQANALGLLHSTFSPNHSSTPPMPAFLFFVQWLLILWDAHKETSVSQ
jgi:hypothetical protein